MFVSQAIKGCLILTFKCIWPAVCLRQEGVTLSSQFTFKGVRSNDSADSLGSEIIYKNNCKSSRSTYFLVQMLVPC